ncbi:MAG: hypothetical protein ACE5KM_16535, partial [Planctomycetaceae bacterium]
AGAVVLNGENSAEARPNYFSKGFVKKYPKLAGQAKKAKCYVCHGKKKKNRNDYGKAVMKYIGKKKQKNVDAIMRALTKAESEKNADGVTFGSLIKAGKLPGKRIK